MLTCPLGYHQVFLCMYHGAYNLTFSALSTCFLEHLFNCTDTCTLISNNGTYVLVIDIL